MKTRLTGCVFLMLCLVVCVSKPAAFYGQTAATVNPIDFLLNTTSKGWCTSQAGWPRCVYFYRDTEPGTRRNRFYYIKDDPARYERFTWDANYVTLDRDTTWMNTAKNSDSYDAKPFGSLRWAKTSNWTTGQSISYRTRIVGFNVSTCDYAQAGTGGGYAYDDANTKTFEYHPRKFWGGDIQYADSIRVLYPSGNEAHWYARNIGWVAWEFPIGTEKFRWNLRAPDSTSVTPNACNETLGDWPAVFLNQDAMRYVYSPDWDPCHSKANSRGGEFIAGISLLPTGPPRTALSRIGERTRFTGAHTGLVSTDANGDNRRTRRAVGGNPDWDPGYWKLECNVNEYVTGVSQNHPNCQGNNHFHGILCGKASSLSNTCRVRVFDAGDSRGTDTSGDWDYATYKGECGPREYVAGVSVNPSTRRPHALLCCQH